MIVFLFAKILDEMGSADLDHIHGKCSYPNLLSLKISLCEIFQILIFQDIDLFSGYFVFPKIS